MDRTLACGAGNRGSNPRGGMLPKVNVCMILEILSLIRVSGNGLVLPQERLYSECNISNKSYGERLTPHFCRV